MLELGLKDAIKDIYLVCWNEEDRKRLRAACRALGFKIVSSEKRHERRVPTAGGQGQAQPGHLRREDLTKDAT